MFEFDKFMAKYVSEIGGFYRRYSDDILVVVGNQHSNRFAEFVEKRLRDTTGNTLQLQTEKTVKSEFSIGENSRVNCDVPLSYLGFDFDGQRKLIRPKTVARYQRRMIQGVNSAKRAAIKAKKRGKESRIRRRELFERYSHLGQRNFVSYAYRCEQIMNAPEIRHQVRKHWETLNRLISVAQLEVDEAGKKAG